ncbi:RagB/SusD family nutrient uptake outer membrane protein [Flagellimonas sp. HMM57]|uniref:RagB/SusD family nutrient uptake outer membrane protein n=1 Tax=unclassified Flagellimonas TaxID=2644544 RepID=UPI0013D356A3|nr:MULTISPECIES: RagB/SusD family nutrient uptake outer membrane protein [unclassified Flagellimonas]UII77191.1 RagB/SusD family nutrient uptake outer membrane protein [Flagellimonas sp. HMM57]
MKTINSIFLRNVALMIAMVFVACDEDVPVENTNVLNANIFFESSNQVEAAVNASYNQFQIVYQRTGYIFPDAMSDEVVSSGDPNFAPFNRFEFNATLDNIAQYWTACFNGIGACNFVIGNEERMRTNALTSDFDDTDINDALGQAYFLRALYYYHLVKRFGGVPLKVDLEEQLVDQPRATVDEVYNQMIDDLILSTQLTFPKGTTETGRVTKEAAYALLGKIYLHRERYSEAQQAFNNVTNHSLLPLEEYRDNFSESGEHNDESMFEIGYNGEVGTEQERWAQTGIGTSEVTFRSQDYTGWANARPSTKVISEFEEDDPRLEQAILIDSDNTYGPGDAFTFPCPGCVGGPVWYKFSQLYDEQNVSENSGINARIMRYADVILMQAEVELNLGNNEAAIDFLNQIRDRAEMPQYGTATMDARGFPVNTSEQIFNAIVHERFVELCGEQQRFDDLVRWNLDDQELSIFPDANFNNPDPSLQVIRNYDPSVHRVMPIPQNEIDSNTAIGQGDQNPGY